MYAPATRSLDTVSEEDLKILPPQAVSTFWDEPTVVASEKAASVMSVMTQLEEERSVKKSYSSSLLSKNRVERYACVYPGCSRRFVNQAELQNHVEILHQIDQEAFRDPEIPYIPETVEQQQAGTEDVAVPSHVIQEYSPEANEDQTVKPVRITAAALEALNLNAEPQPSRCEDQESLSGSDVHASSASMMSFDTTYSALDHNDEVAASDVAKPDDPRIKLAVSILLTLWARFLSDFAGRKRAGHRQQGQYQGAYHQQSSPSQSSSHASSSASVASSARDRKRKKNLDDDGDENRRKAPSVRASQGQASPENMPLACPFNKYNSHAFGGDAQNSAYHVCSTWHDVKTAYLKQHLLRNHCLPQYHCARCGLDCKNDGDLRVHMRLPTPCAVKELDSQKLMPEVQQELGLRARNAVKTNRTEYWYKVYDTIFGKEARISRPVEPYYKGPSHEIIEAFLHFSERRMSQALRQSRPTSQADSEDYNENNTELVRTVLQEASQNFIAERRAAEQQSLREIRERNAASSTDNDSGEQTVLVREQQSIEQQPSTGVSESTPHTWLPARFDISQPSNIAAFQHSPHTAQHTQNQYYDLPTRNAEHTLTQQQAGGKGYDQPTDFSYSSMAHDSFGLDMGDPEFLATLEDPDMYSAHSVDMNNIEGYGYHEAPSQRDP